MNLIQKNKWNLQKCSIGCMTAYTYGDYIYFNKNIDTPNEHNNHFILNQILDFYITSPSKLIGGIFSSLPKLFVNKMIKECINSHIQIVAHLSKFVNGKNILNRQNLCILQEGK